MRSLGVAALLLLGACGPSIRGDDGTDLTVDLPDRDELADAEVLYHYQLDALLRMHTVEKTDEVGNLYRLVDYAALVEPEAQLALTDYVAGISAVDPINLRDTDEKLAFYMNAYNAWVLVGVLGKYAEDPEYDVESDQWALFAAPYISMGGWEISPNDLEHGIIRGDEYTFEAYADQPEFVDFMRGLHEDLWVDEPVDGMIHVGVNCASLGCPNIQAEAWQGSKLDEQLASAATEFLDNSAKGAGPDGVTQLFSWFRGDFEGSYGSLEQFVSDYRTEGTTDVNFDATLPYDWGLNDIGADLSGSTTD